MFSKFFTFIPSDDRSNQPWHFDRMFSKTFYLITESIISKSIYVLKLIVLNFEHWLNFTLSSVRKVNSRMTHAVSSSILTRVYNYPYNLIEKSLKKLKKRLTHKF